MEDSDKSLGDRESPLPRLLIIGAGARGNAYARAVTRSGLGIIASVAEPVPSKRTSLGDMYIWHTGKRQEDQEFDLWQDYVEYERVRRRREEAGEKVLPGFDGIFICTLDETHVEVITALAPFGLHIMSEKPIATTLHDCMSIYRALQGIAEQKSTLNGMNSALGPRQPSASSPLRAIFSVGHVLRYSPHNMLLRRLLLGDNVIGDTIAIEHTEPVGWWHFSHSYVRGNWRKESKTAPSLLTKSCHDVDFLLWLLCSPPPSSNEAPHLPSLVTSVGSLAYFKRSRKPVLAGDATNCLSCPAERECMYSAKKIYYERHLAKGKTGWPVDIVDPEIEDCLADLGDKSRAETAAKAKLMQRLAENYSAEAPQSEIEKRPWFGRCVYESDNDVCDDQMVTITWDEDPLPLNGVTEPSARYRGAKTAAFHMVAFTEKQCERRGRIYGTKGEIEYDSKVIKVHDFTTGKTEIYHPHQPGGGHGGGDDGLAQQYVKAIDAVKNQKMSVEEAQHLYIGCCLEEVIRSHAMVFAAEEARREKKVVVWTDWWAANVEGYTSKT